MYIYMHTWFLHTVVFSTQDGAPTIPIQVSVLQHWVDNEAQLLESEYLGNQEK